MKDHKTNDVKQSEELDGIRDRRESERLERERVAKDYKRNTYKLKNVEVVG